MTKLNEPIVLIERSNFEDEHGNVLAPMEPQPKDPEETKKKDNTLVVVLVVVLLIVIGMYLVKNYINKHGDREDTA